MNVQDSIFPQVSGKEPDFNLLASRLVQMALKGEQPEKCISTLRRTELRRHLSPGQLKNWSEAALVLGEVELALEILAYINESHSDDPGAWQKRFELLKNLHRFEEAESIRARALSLYPDLNLGSEPSPGIQQTQAEEDAEDIDDPFVRHRKQEELIQLYLSLFQGRSEVFARQWVDKEKNTQGYMPVRRPMTEQDLLEHLKGRKTYGIYLLNHDSRVKTSVVDMDLKKTLRTVGLKASDRPHLKRERDYLLQRLDELSRQRFGTGPLVEFSGGKGYHLWFFFEQPVPAGWARQALLPMVSMLSRDCSYFNLEIFPKQDQLQGKCLGNLVKLPLGLHRVTGKPSYFRGSSKNDPWANIRQLQNVQLIRSETLQQIQDQNKQDKLTPHPRQKQWAEKYPELHLLNERCPALGRIITALRTGRELGIREERVLFQTVGFLSRARTLMHHLCQNLPEYNSHLVDYKLSRLRGTPMGCRKIHQLLNMNLDYCLFEPGYPYAHPLLHCPRDLTVEHLRSEKVENLNDALEQLKISLETVLKYLPGKKG